MSLPRRTPDQVPGGQPIFDEVSLDATIISTRTINGKVVILSRYGDPKWRLVGQPTNKCESEQYVDFTGIPSGWWATMKAILWHYMRRGREGKKRPSPRAVRKLLTDAKPFLLHLGRLKITRLADVTPFACSLFVDACQQHRQGPDFPRAGKPLKASSLGHLYGAVEALHELSQYTSDEMPDHPWHGTSATHLAGLTGQGTAYRGGNTPLMPDDVFATLFQRAWLLVETADDLLDVRDKILSLRKAAGGKAAAEHDFIRSQGWADMWAFNQAVLQLRTACYIVVASLSGCRNHELGFVQRGACYSTEAAAGDEDEPRTYSWMRSQSTKTGEGLAEWMVPEAAVTALKVMERWSVPYRSVIDAEITDRRSENPLDPELAEAQLHLNAVFLAMTPNKGNQVRTMSLGAWNKALKSFAQNCGLGWDLASHHFRRKFANYAARSQFGDLRYLQSHFKHWSTDMTLGYALNESQEIALYAEIQMELDDIKADVVDGWLRPGTPLAGGYGRNIVSWRDGQAVTIFKDHRQMVRSLAESTPIRSNGHAWCTADDSRCVGNDLERTRCSGCNNAVIGPEHAPIYRGLHDHLQEVLDCDDIGEGGRNLVRRDMQRCRDVLVALRQGVTPGAASP
ncbi:hypothetical protein AWV79_17355 [Cupriavidus sp. UYMMa02A]|nr:hypothetical protein AWV79_17355 [Cupriavidus sp. UYMMa02A]